MGRFFNGGELVGSPTVAADSDTFIVSTRYSVGSPTSRCGFGLPLYWSNKEFLLGYECFFEKL